MTEDQSVKYVRMDLDEHSEQITFWAVRIQDYLIQKSPNHASLSMVVALFMVAAEILEANPQILNTPDTFADMAKAIFLHYYHKPEEEKKPCPP